MVRAITGIPYYYRLFGYEMAMTLGGSRKGIAPTSALKEDETEPYLIRPANPDDLPWIARTAEQNWPVRFAPLRNAAQWRYELDGKDAFDIQPCDPVYDHHPVRRTGRLPGVSAYRGEPPSLAPPTSWLRASPGTPVTPTVLRFLWKIGRKTVPR